MRPCLRKVGVLTDRPPGTPSTTAQTQDGVNTVGPVPMTFGYGPNTFPHSAAHVLNTNHSPSRSEGEPNKSTYASAANDKLPSTSEGDSNVNFSARKSVPKNPHFTTAFIFFRRAS